MIEFGTVIASGDILAGKYTIERVLAKGGMGYVFAARHAQLDQRVAIKILMPELCENQAAVARFLREARAAVRIRSEHVARVLDVGTRDDGAPYMVMEFLEGHDLARELADRGVLPVAEAVEYLLQACEALAEAHALGIVHRDLKPANLFLTHRSDGSPLIKVLDFGISKGLLEDGTETGTHLTSTQGLIGSPHYMSPEQIRAPKSVDARSDIWSLGINLFQLLSGSPPFAAETPMGILAAVVTDAPPDLTAIRPDVSIALQSVIVRCLEKDPRRRYRNVVEFAQGLQEFAPLGHAAVVRIAAIAGGGRERSRSGPQTALLDADAPTLESGSSPPESPKPESAARKVFGSAAGYRGSSGQSGAWGHSQDTAGTSRGSLALLFGASCVVGIAAYLYGSRAVVGGKGAGQHDGDVETARARSTSALERPDSSGAALAADPPVRGDAEAPRSDAATEVGGRKVVSATNPAATPESARIGRRPDGSGSTGVSAAGGIAKKTDTAKAHGVGSASAATAAGATPVDPLDGRR